MNRTIFTVLFLFVISISLVYAQADVTFTVVDSTEQYVKIMFKGTPTAWDTIPMYDDGTNNDPVANDHRWTVTVLAIPEGDHDWGAIEDDGSEWGIWLIQGPNPAFNITGTTVTGQTSYTIPPPSEIFVDVTFTIIDSLQQYVKVMFKGTPTNWDTIPMYDDGTNDDPVAGDHQWTVTVDSVGQGIHEWGAIEDDGTEWGIWLIQGPNPSFTVTGTTVTGTITYGIPLPGETGTGDVEFSVNMEVMDYIGIFDNVNDTLMVRASFNGWGTTDLLEQDFLEPNLFVLNKGFTDEPLGVAQYKFFVDIEDTANSIWVDAYERPLSAGGGNRSFEFIGAASLILPTAYYDDVHPDWIIEDNTNLQVTFSVDMRKSTDPDSQAIPFDPATDNVWWIDEQPTFIASQGWADSDTMNILELTDANNDTIYEGTLTVIDPAFNAFEYRYAFYDVSEETYTLEPDALGTDDVYRVRFVGQDAVRSFPVNPWTMPMDTWTNKPVKTDQESDPFTSLTGIDDDAMALPDKFTLYQNYPNPFNPTTNFKFDLPAQSDVKLIIYNVLGQEVVRVIDDNLKAGEYAKTWNGLDQHGNRIASGVYFYKLLTNSHTAVKKLIMLK